MNRGTYLDYCATTPVDQRVAQVVMEYMQYEFGNAGSRTHEYGLEAARAVEGARADVAALCGSRPDEVFFTSGATEANNLALLGAAPAAAEAGNRHVLALAIEHKAVLEPLEALSRTFGMDVELVPVGLSGWVEPEEIARRLRPNTALVSTMHANNETGVIQPLEEIANALVDHPAYWHVDAAQTFGKLPGLENSRIDLVSMSSHKLYGPMGVGALIARRRGYTRPPIRPLLFGGGQERGMRPGTLPVPLVAGLGEACRLALAERDDRSAAALAERTPVIEAFQRLNASFTGDQSRVLPHVVNVSVPNLDAEAAMMLLRDLVAISNGSACTSSTYEPSHVLVAMGLPLEQCQRALRVSWSHHPIAVDWEAVVDRLKLATQ